MPNQGDAANRSPGAMTSSQHVYEVRPRKDHRGFDLISDVLPFGSLVVRRAGRNQVRKVLQPLTMML